MPTLRPASTRLVPASTSTVRSLMVTLGTLSSVSEIAALRERAALLADVLLDLGEEALDQRGDRTDRGVAQGAQRVAADVAADGEQDLAVGRGPLAMLEPLQHQLHPVRPLAARRALAAGLVVGG